jgi:hypothetical protein
MDGNDDEGCSKVWESEYDVPDSHSRAENCQKAEMGRMMGRGVPWSAQASEPVENDLWDSRMV